jgi:hypothetical protein
LFVEGEARLAEEQFSVQPDAVRGYAGLLERNLGYIGEMRTYLDGPGSETTDLGGLMAQFQNLVEDISRAQRDTLNTMQQKLSDTINGVKATADQYANTDAKHAAELDNVVPKAPDDGKYPGKGAI